MNNGYKSKLMSRQIGEDNVNNKVFLLHLSGWPALGLAHYRDRERLLPRENPSAIYTHTCDVKLKEREMERGGRLREKGREMEKGREKER